MREQAGTRAVSVKPPGVQITSVADRTILQFRSWLPRQANRPPVVLAGKELPSQVGAMICGPTRVLCVGPQHWLLVSEEHGIEALRERIDSDLAAQGLVFADLTDGLFALELRGTAARELLSKGCGLDLHVSRFSEGQCTRTRFAQIAVTVACLDESPRFELFVARSHEHYLRDWMVDAVELL